MDSTVARQKKGLGFSFQASRNSPIASIKSGTLGKESRGMRLLVSSPKPTFDEVEPTATGGHKVNHEARMALEPRLDDGMALGSAVIDHQLQAKVG